MEFVHLHLHSQYSFLDGASTIDTLLNKAGMLGMSALALTDHNRLTGAIRFYQKARACGIKPIIGVELDMAGGYHLTLLCKDSTGYSNLCRLLTAAHLSSATGSPAACVDMLREHRSGLIALSGCSKGEIPSLLQCGKVEEARRASCFYRDVYGEDYFIELICHPSRYGMAAAHRLAAFARDMHIPAVATNNVHYADREDYRIKELLNAISRNVPVASLKGCRTVEQYLKTAQEMRELFRDFPGPLR
jgi:DNA polymerase III alpha subunit